MRRQQHAPGLFKLYQAGQTRFVTRLGARKGGAVTLGRHQRVLTPVRSALQVDKRFFDLPHGLPDDAPVFACGFFVPGLGGIHIGISRTAVVQGYRQRQRAKRPGVVILRKAACAGLVPSHVTAYVQARVTLGACTTHFKAGGSQLPRGVVNVGPLAQHFRRDARNIGDALLQAGGGGLCQLLSQIRLGPGRHGAHGLDA